ncbi:MAG: aminoacyl-histidine dipeptidase [Bacteroidales bacterium]|nr:aminoacyl-histidine dipeptidase [Bacteroidales bacterium]
MNQELLNLYPHDLWENFGHICDAPHPSKHEEAVVKWLKSWAADHQVKCEQDATGNLLFTIPATPGMENRMPVILQAHCDMVPQADSDKKHDFLTDPIEPIIDNGWVRANKTTLGADDGIGVAAALAAVTTPGVEHGPLEILVTIDEETGMTGAFGLKEGFVKGKILINLDSETEGELYVGCAGGLDANFERTYKTMKTPADMKGYKLFVTGLHGGHSGMDINLGRANANKIATRFMKRAVVQFGACISTVNGGSLRNAIPREATVILAVPASKAAEFEAFAKEFEATVKNEFAKTEEGMSITVSGVDTPKEVIETKAQNQFINMIFAIPNGVQRMSDSMADLVETSNNLAAMHAENGKMSAICLLRSSVNSAKDALGDRMTAVAELAECNIELTGAYPGWKPNMESPIMNTCKTVYNQKFGHDPKIMAIHAGLECGLFGVCYPDWDMVSFGPTIEHPHSPVERVNIESVGKFFDFLVAVLKNVAVR